MLNKYLLLFLLFCFTINFGYGQTYNQITALGDLTDGNYLIVGDGNTNDGLMVNSTAGSVYIDHSAITNPGATITTGYTANNVFNITVSGGNITIYNASVGYVSWGRTGATGNDADFFSGTIADTERWTPTVNSGLWSLANVDDVTRILEWNNSSPRFVAYTSGQVKLKLYKEVPSGNTITVTQATGGTITPGTTNVPDNTDQSFTAATDSCHSFTNWVVDGSDAGNSNPYTFTNVTAAHTITAVYTIDTYTITASSGANGSISPSGSTNVDCGTTQAYTFNPDPGYAVQDILVDGVSVGSANSYDFINVTAAHTISVTFMVYLAPCGLESFDNSNATSAYANNNFVGDNGVTWTYIASRDENGDANGSGINGNALMLRRSSDNSRVTSSLVTNGIEDFTVKLYKGFTGAGNRQVELFVNGISQGTSTPFDDFNEHIFTVTGINITGDVTVELRNITANQIIVDDIEWSCYSPCTPTHSVTSFAPTEGPIGTQVTVTGGDFTTSTTVSFSGIASTNVTYIDSDGDSVIDTLLAEVPAGTTSGNIAITEMGCEIYAASNFNILDNTGGCISSSLSDLIITELYDKSSGSLGYIEVYNGTGSAINLSGYSIRRYGDSDDLCGGFYTLYTFPVTTPTINNNQVLYGKIFSPAEPTDDATPNFSYDVDCSFTGGGLDCNGDPYFVNPSCGGFNGSDIFHLYNGATLIDVYENPNSGIGYSVLRDTNTAGPNSTSNPSDWTYSGTESISDLGTFVYTGSIISYPSATNPTTSTASCINTVSFTSNGTTSLGGPLTYQWYFNDGVNSTWSLVNATNLPETTISGETNAVLTLTNGLSNYDNYQFYCLITESGTCSKISNAAQLKLGTATWDGNWIWNDGTLLNTVPTLSTHVIINANYDTSVGVAQTSFGACSLTVNAGFNLAIQNNTYIDVQNDIIANGDITVQTQGSVVQRNDLATVTANGIITVQKMTTTLTDAYNYTYWSSPVVGETIENVFNNVSRRFIFNAANFIDVLDEIDNTNTFTPGQDDIDDNGDDWQPASGAMIPAIGYAATPRLLGPAFPVAQQFPFVGAFNNGVFTPTIVNNSGGAYNDWNFIGNPYPSAIDAVEFFSVNSGITNNIYLWSQATALNANASGNEGNNFSGADYAIINASGVNVAGGDGIIPNNFVPSGQGFFIEAISGTNITFNNSMRVTGNNNQFFRSANTTNSRKVLWLNLSSDNGVAKQIAVAHLEGATDNYDGSYYDVKENLSSSLVATIYSTISESDNQFVIQGKNNSSLDENEVINLGFKTVITVPTLYTISIAQFEGDFYTENNIYIKDNLLSTFHNLKDSNYTFTSEAGEFNERFEIVFRANPLSIDNNIADANDLTIIELANGDVKFKVNSKQNSITNVEILDLLGRRVYNFTGNSFSEIYNLSKLSQSAYIAKITLSNGQVISKKAIKK